MKEQSKDNLENFFRHRAQNHNLEFNEADWHLLKSQLDKEMPVGLSFLQFLRKYRIGALVLLLIPISWFSYDKIIQNEDKATIISNHNQNITSRVPDNESSKINPTENNSTTISKEITQKETSVREVSIKPDLSNSEGKEYEDLAMGPSSTPINNESNIENTGQVVMEEGVDADGHIVSKQLLFLFPISPDYMIEETIQEINYVEEMSEFSPIRKTRSYFKLGFGYSPDFSTVGIGNFVSPGSRWTATAEYSILNRFILSTGVVLVNNKYEAYGEDYHAPSRYWRNGIVADEAYGECQMIDIPLNLRYNFLQNGKNKVFVSAGASTYFVTKEDYYFHYEHDDPDLPQHWGTDKTTIYPFGIINMSIGIEHEFTRRSGLQIEPFIKIPTTGIGWGNVDLHTMGVYFMYKYKL